MRLLDVVERRRLSAAALAVVLCVMSAGVALAQERLEDAWLTGSVIEKYCAEATAAQDPKALDKIDNEVKQQLEKAEKSVRNEEESLKSARQTVRQLREKYDNLRVQKARAREELEKAQNAGQPASITASFHTRIANLEKEQSSVQRQVVDAGSEANEYEDNLRSKRGALGVVRVMVRAIQICVEKRRPALQPPAASNPTPPGGLLAAPFILSGSWAGACGTFAVNGTFTANVGQGGAVSGRYAYTGGKTGTLSGTLGADGKLAVGSGRESDFAVRWVGNVVPGARGPSGNGTWSGSAQGLNCGGSWKSTGGQPT